MSKKPSNEKLIELINKSGGIILPIATALHVSRRAVYDWIHADKELSNAMDDARESTIDIVESKYFKSAINGDTRAQEFLLKTLGKNRGYVEKQEVSANVDSSLNLPKLTGEDIEKLKEINGLQ